jgi:hypothetical protein
VRSVCQAGPSFGLRAADSPDMLRVRSAERLRHKNRASTLWDFERLVLDAFPQVFKVKCFAHCQTLPDTSTGAARLDAELARPGQVLVVVVPAPRFGQLFSSTEEPRLDASVLSQIADYLRQRAHPAAHITVRNASYERIQVRCTIRLAPGRHPGTAVRSVNQSIVEYLSPWYEGGCTADFDWVVSAEAVAAHLRCSDCVASVERISLLHIVHSDHDYYRLADTARSNRPVPGAAASGARRSVVVPARPWSLALPTAQHLIDVLPSDAPATDGKADGTGVGLLAIGGTFVIGSSNGGGAP